MNLPSCNCVVCQANVARLAEPVVLMTEDQATAKRAAYEEARKAHRVQHPIIQVKDGN